MGSGACSCCSRCTEQGGAESCAISTYSMDNSISPQAFGVIRRLPNLGGRRWANVGGRRARVAGRRGGVVPSFVLEVPSHGADGSFSKYRCGGCSRGTESTGPSSGASGIVSADLERRKPIRFKDTCGHDDVWVEEREADRPDTWTRGRSGCSSSPALGQRHVDKLTRRQEGGTPCGQCRHEDKRARRARRHVAMSTDLRDRDNNGLTCLHVRR